MDISQLRSFVTIAECGTVARAAELLHLSQPAISAHIKLLEEELRLRVFSRHSRGMSLTAAGEAIFKHAKKILHSVEALKDEANTITGEVSGELVVGIGNDPAFLRLPAFLKIMREKAPNVSISLVPAPSGAVMKNIADGIFDAGFVEGSPREQDISSIFLTKVEFVVGYPTAWDARIEEGRPATALSLPWIGTSEDCSLYQLTTALFRSHGLVFRPEIRTDQEALLLDLVSEEAGLSLVRREMLDGYLKGGVSALNGVVVEADMRFVASNASAKPGLLRVAQQAIKSVWAT